MSQPHSSVVHFVLGEQLRSLAQKYIVLSVRTFRYIAKSAWQFKTFQWFLEEKRRSRGVLNLLSERMLSIRVHACNTSLSHHGPLPHLVSCQSSWLGRGWHYISKVCGGIYDSLLSEQRSICRARNCNFIVPFLALGNGRVIAWLLGASQLNMRVWESLVKSQVRTKTPHLVYSFSCRNANHMVRSALSRSMCSFPASKTKSTAASVNVCHTKLCCFHYVFDVSAGGIGIYGQR